jgi:hypothetical protein
MVSLTPLLPQLPSVMRHVGGYDIEDVDPSLPTLSLNFVDGEQLDSRVTFTRASSATRVNSSGLIEVVGNNVPRFDYDPVTLLSRGLVVEEQRANICTASEEFNLWTQSASTTQANVDVAPNGLSVADRIVEDSANAVHQISRSLTYLTGTVYTVSVYAKASGRTRFNLNFPSSAFGSGMTPMGNFDLTAVTASPLNGASALIVPAGNGWFRCIVTLPITTAGATGVFPRVGLQNASGMNTYLGDGTSGILLWGMQVEAGAFATSYVPTTSGSTATRAAELPTITQDNWYRSDEGTWVAEFLLSAPGTSRRILNTAGTNDGLININASNLAQVSNGVVAISTANAVVAGVNKAGVVYSADGRGICLNAGDVVSDALLVPVATVGFRVGTRGDVLWSNSHIRSVKFWSRRVTSAELQVLTQ